MSNRRSKVEQSTCYAWNNCCSRMGVDEHSSCWILKSFEFRIVDQNCWKPLGPQEILESYQKNNRHAYGNLRLFLCMYHFECKYDTHRGKLRGDFSCKMWIKPRLMNMNSFSSGGLPTRLSAPLTRRVILILCSPFFVSLKIQRRDHPRTVPA